MMMVSMVSTRSWTSCLLVTVDTRVTDSDTALVTASWRQRRAGPVSSTRATTTVRDSRGGRLIRNVSRFRAAGEIQTGAEEREEQDCRH